MRSANMIRRFVGAAVVVAALLASSRPASADPITIGTLSVDLNQYFDDDLGDFVTLGWLLNVTNLSAGLPEEAPFDNVSLNLQYADLSGVDTLDFGGAFGDLPSFILNGRTMAGFLFSSVGPSSAVALDISDLPLFASVYSSVYLSLLFQSTLIENTSVALVEGALAPIVYESARVPEPGTWLLIGCGFGVALMTRRRRAGLAPAAP